jgi:hypothetical protein
MCSKFDLVLVIAETSFYALSAENFTRQQAYFVEELQIKQFLKLWESLLKKESCSV